MVTNINKWPLWLVLVLIHDVTFRWVLQQIRIPGEVKRTSGIPSGLQYFVCLHPEKYPPLFYFVGKRQSSTRKFRYTVFINGYLHACIFPLDFILTALPSSFPWYEMVVKWRLEKRDSVLSPPYRSSWSKLSSLQSISERLSVPWRLRAKHLSSRGWKALETSQSLVSVSCDIVVEGVTHRSIVYRIFGQHGFWQPISASADVDSADKSPFWCVMDLHAKRRFGWILPCGHTPNKGGNCHIVSH